MNSFVVYTACEVSALYDYYHFTYQQIEAQRGGLAIILGKSKMEQAPLFPGIMMNKYKETGLHI